MPWFTWLNGGLSVSGILLCWSRTIETVARPVEDFFLLGTKYLNAVGIFMGTRDGGPNVSFRLHIYPINLIYSFFNLFSPPWLGARGRRCHQNRSLLWLHYCRDNLSFRFMTSFSLGSDDNISLTHSRVVQMIGASFPLAHSRAVRQQPSPTSSAAISARRRRGKYFTTTRTSEITTVFKYELMAR